MSLTASEEFDILEAVRMGNAARFEELVLAYEKSIYNLCLRMLGNEQDALDASQEAFFRAYRSLRSFRGDSRFSTWLYRLASNACLDILRRRTRSPESAWDDDLLVPALDGGPTPQEALERKELHSAVDRALDTLAPEFRQAVVLRDVAGLSYAEIAEAAGLEEGTVKSRIFRARRKLAEALRADGNFSELYPSKDTNKNGGKGGGV